MGDVIYHGTSIMSKYTIYWIYLHGYWMIIIQYNLYIYIQYDHNKYLYGSLYYHGNISNMMYISDMTNIIYNIIYIYIYTIYIYWSPRITFLGAFDRFDAAGLFKLRPLSRRLPGSHRNGETIGSPAPVNVNGTRTKTMGKPKGKWWFNQQTSGCLMGFRVDL
jgi:hypothetical protein